MAVVFPGEGAKENMEKKNKKERGKFRGKAKNDWEGGKL